MEALTLLNNQLHHFSTALEELTQRASTIKQATSKKAESLIVEREGVSSRHKIITELKYEIDVLNSELLLDSNNECSLKRRLGDLILRNKSILFCLAARLDYFSESDRMKSQAAALVEAKVTYMYHVPCTTR